MGLEESAILNSSYLLGTAFNENPGTVISNSISAGPLYTFFYGLITFLFNSSVVAPVVISTILVFIQAVIFNTTLQRNAAFEDNTYLPGILYAIILSSSQELLYLSPALMANTFLLLATDKILIHLKFRGSEENILTTGFLLGLSALCYTPYSIFLIFTILIYVVYSGTLVRRYFLMAYGFIFSFLVFWIYYLCFQQGAAFIGDYFSGLFRINELDGTVLNNILLIFGLPLFLTVLSGAQSFQGAGLTNHQILIQRMMLWMLIFALVTLRLDNQLTLLSAETIAIPMTFFTTQFLLTRGKRWVAEVVFLLLAISSITFLFTL
ncbi:hypothetical protein MB14_12575 [Roseivirga ehrenbergii]|uniref:Glycosyltransferase RgtA/B/C/D-like domain-containing protein n=2 Tax=Roseivirga ehrenbergii (strain DSM 102268 / JCM 13514 / KCTC 12282 / NCIMB 14502 / KMM 6017) TaxID=279360 RepID=A0A150XRV4_ROSEK|nr:hypothetical protein MB14_12575 [Roseivirga ehrenbergii]